MGLDLLDAPVRLTWDLHGTGGALPDEPLRRIAEQLVAAGLFFVTLEERPLTAACIAELLGMLADGGCQVLVSCDGTPAELQQLEAALPLRALLLNTAPFLSTDGLDRAALETSVETIRSTGCEPVLSLTPLRSNLHQIPALIAACGELSIGKLKLPNAKINDRFRAYSEADLPRFDDLERFRAIWRSWVETSPVLPTLEIHDLFLWEIMTPGHQDARSEYGGCQAGNSLGYVDSRGMLYPCAAWPVPLGSLLEASLADLWQSSRRFAVREQVAAVPAGCLDCREYPLCHGGCRGLACLYHDENRGRDLMCRGPR